LPPNDTITTELITTLKTEETIVASKAGNEEMRLEAPLAEVVSIKNPFCFFSTINVTCPDGSVCQVSQERKSVCEAFIPSPTCDPPCKTETCEKTILYDVDCLTYSPCVFPPKTDYYWLGLILPITVAALLFLSGSTFFAILLFKKFNRKYVHLKASIEDQDSTTTPGIESTNDTNSPAEVNQPPTLEAAPEAVHSPASTAEVTIVAEIHPTPNRAVTALANVKNKLFKKFKKDVESDASVVIETNESSLSPEDVGVIKSSAAYVAAESAYAFVSTLEDFPLIRRQLFLKMTANGLDEDNICHILDMSEADARENLANK
jgi:hypothetical protein